MNISIYLSNYECRCAHCMCECVRAYACVQTCTTECLGQMTELQRV